jgi:hypothetical protein
MAEPSGYVRPRLSGWKRQVAAMGLTLLALAIVTGARAAGIRIVGFSGCRTWQA